MVVAVGVDADEGLSADRVEEMRQRYGANEMGEADRTGLEELLWESLTSPMMLLLLAVAGISLALGQSVPSARTAAFATWLW